MKKRVTKKAKEQKPATTKSVDSFIQSNFANSFFTLYNPKHSEYQPKKLNETAPKSEDIDGFNSPLTEFYLEDDIGYKESRESALESFDKFYQKNCSEIIDPANDIPIAFSQKLPM